MRERERERGGRREQEKGGGALSFVPPSANLSLAPRFGARTVLPSADVLVPRPWRLPRTYERRRSRRSPTKTHSTDGSVECSTPFSHVPKYSAPDGSSGSAPVRLAELAIAVVLPQLALARVLRDVVAHEEPELSLHRCLSAGAAARRGARGTALEVRARGLGRRGHVRPRRAWSARAAARGAGTWAAPAAAAAAARPRPAGSRRPRRRGRRRVRRRARVRLGAVEQHAARARHEARRDAGVDLVVVVRVLVGRRLLLLLRLRRSPSRDRRLGALGGGGASPSRRAPRAVRAAARRSAPPRGRYR